ncbi:MAG: MFS transporter [Parachlamydiaceae bacterium]
MTVQVKTSASLLHVTRSTYLWTRILGTPFWSLINLLTFILYKDLHINPLQITLLVALKPMSSLFAPYWSQAIHQRPDKIVSNLIWSNIIRYLPFLFLPWMNSWLIVLAFAFYMMLYRATIPGWMELFKLNLPEKEREKTLGYACIIDYCGAALMALILGIFLDRFEQSWRFLFPIMSLLGLASTWLLKRIPSPSPPHEVSQEELKYPTLIKEGVVKPWKQAWKLVVERPDFAHFQIGFMLGGAGLMIMQPALPVFFVDTLKLSYVEMSFALAICKGVGVTLASPLWTKLFSRTSIYTFCGFVTLLATGFPLLLLAAPYNLALLFMAYIFYGVMQAGSEMGWHMSGLSFAREKESSAFSTINVLTVGIRGCIVPALGAIIWAASSSIEVMLLGGLFCFLATCHLLYYGRRHSEEMA